MTYGIEAALTLSERLTLNARIDHEERGSDATSDDGGIQLVLAALPIEFGSRQNT